MLAHLRTEAYRLYATHQYPPWETVATQGPPEISYEENNRLIDEAKRQVEATLAPD